VTVSISGRMPVSHLSKFVPLEWSFAISREVRFHTAGMSGMSFYSLLSDGGA